MEEFISQEQDNEPLEYIDAEDFANMIPADWIATGRVSQDTARNRVHSGISSAALYNEATLSQIVPIEGGCFYKLSFFGHGEGALVGVTATVTFISASGNETGLEIVIRPGDLPNSSGDFAHYRGITTRAPENAESAEIKFAVTSAGGQYLDLDDVSFSVQ